MIKMNNVKTSLHTWKYSLQILIFTITANDVAIQALKKNAETLKIPDQSGKASGFKYEIKK